MFTSYVVRTRSISRGMLMSTLPCRLPWEYVLTNEPVDKDESLIRYNVSCIAIGVFREE